MLNTLVYSLAETCIKDGTKISHSVQLLHLAYFLRPILYFKY